MQYHSEPITRNLTANWHTNQAKKLGARFNGDTTENGEIIVAEEYVQSFIEEWESSSDIDALNDERQKYFSLSTVTMHLFSAIGLLLAMLAFTLSPFLLGELQSSITDPNLYNVLNIAYGIFFLPMTVFFMISRGHAIELKKAKKDENYLPSFKSDALLLCTLLGVVAALAIVLLINNVIL